MKSKMNFSTIIARLWGVAVLLAGLINTFWGNDPEFGVFLILLSLLYFPIGDSVVKKIFGRSIHWAVKLLLALVIAWMALGVGELFDKVDLMMQDF